MGLGRPSNTIVPTVWTLASQLIELGVTLAKDEGYLRYSPKSAVTPELISRLKAHKADLLKLLPDLAGTLCAVCGKPQIVGRVTGVVRCFDPFCEETRAARLSGCLKSPAIVDQRVSVQVAKAW